MTTSNWIGFDKSARSTAFLQGFDPARQQFLPEKFALATPDEADNALQKAATAFPKYAQLSGKQRAVFLRAIAQEIEMLGEPLIQRAMSETGLPEARVRGERARTMAQLILFAQLLEEGNWVEAIIDTALPDRQPLPRPDLRRMLVPVGPVVVFSVSNFPLAYSTAGTDVASALAAGCPVVVKAHECHPGTHAFVAEAVVRAAQKTGMPDGVFSSLFGKGHDLGKQLVQHPLTKSVAFTGSPSGGRALFDLAAARPEPIPVFAEMGSINPVYILPEKMKSDPVGIARQLAASTNLNAGQFCTCPSVFIFLEDENSEIFLQNLRDAFANQPSQTMLAPHIFQNFERKKLHALQQKGITTSFSAEKKSDSLQGFQTLAVISAKNFLKNEVLHEEVFGPFALAVACKNRSEMQRVAESFSGQLTTTLHATENEATRWRALIELAQQRAGRLIFNGVPTGLEVCAAVHHGGPYPATTDSRFTSVGTGAVRRFVRPVCFQNYPEKLLPPALRNNNPLKIWRLVDGVFTKKSISNFVKKNNSTI